jgi:hypothetical protein
MKQLLIAKPVDWSIMGAATAGGAGLDNLLTPDPKEAWITSNAAAQTVRALFAAPTTIDTAHLGFTDLPHGTTVDFYTFTNADGTGEAALGSYAVDNPTGDSRPRHAFAQGAPRANVRGIRATMTQPAARAAIVGVMSAGLALAPYWGHEYGAGRFVIDTGTKERLFGGGFGIQLGARAGGYQWTFGDLTEEEVEALYKLALDAGETASVLVIENPDTVEPGLNERVHWSIIDKIEAYERFAPGASRWAFKVLDWA